VNFYLKRASEIRPISFDYINLGGITAQIIVYDDTVMSHLALYPEIKFKQFPEYLDSYIADMGSRTRESVILDFTRFKEYYFNHQSDPVREKAFLDFLRK
jgi:hypothetical protein